MIFVLLFFGGLAYVHYGVKKQQVEEGDTNKTVSQPISYQAAQGFAVGSPETPGYRKRWVEGNKAIAQPQRKILKGANAATGTDRLIADLNDRLSSTFDPQWRMRFMNAFHRMTLQSDIDNGKPPRAALNVDRVSEEVNNDRGEASGFTRTQITYQHRFTRGRPRAGYGPNATRPIDQEDPGDTTSLQTTLKPNGHKAVIFPYAVEDKDGIKKLWPGMKTRDLEKEFWAKSGRSYNQVGATQEAMPTHKGWNWSLLIPKRNKHGANVRMRTIPGRSNPNNDSVNSGQG